MSLQVQRQSACAEPSPELEERIKATARKVYRIIGATDYARVDFRGKTECRKLLELNPNPDIASDVDEDTGFTRSKGIRMDIRRADTKCNKIL